MPKILHVGFIVALAFFANFSSGFAAPKESLTADQIIWKAILQSRLSEKNLESTGYTFTKATEREQFDDDGRVQDRKNSLHEMHFKSGSLSRKRIPIPGEDVAEARKIEAQENKAALKAAKRKVSTRGEFLEILTPELIRRYSFTLLKKVNLNGRPTFELAFQPKDKNLPSKGLEDRVLNQATGRIWVDAQEFEVAKAQVHLDSEILVGGGLLGCLKKGVFILERTRLPGGVWFDRSMKADYEARRLAVSMRVISKSELRNFQILSDNDS